MFPKDSRGRDAAARRPRSPEACLQSWQLALRPVWRFACLHACIGDGPQNLSAWLVRRPGDSVPLWVPS